MDLIGRLFIIERAEADQYRLEPERSRSRNSQPVESDTNATQGEQLEMQTVHKDTRQSDPTPELLSNTEDVTSTAASQPIPAPSLSLIQVVQKLLGTPRAITVLLSTLIYGYARIFVAILVGVDTAHSIVYSSQEPVVPLYLQALWGLNSSKVGLVYLAAVIPTLFCKS